MNRSIIMCDYCNKYKELSSINFCGRGKMRIFKNEIDIYENKSNIIDLFFRRIYNPTFKINYCPMCGRQLNDTSN